jgi:transposase
MALSDDLRERLVAAVEAGQSRRAAGERFGVSAASAVRWMQRVRETGKQAAFKGVHLKATLHPLDEPICAV